jgi:hypothetical protein
METSCPTEEASLPHLASIMYFRSSPKTQPPSCFRDSMTAPTPRRMAAVGGVTPNKSHGRRCSSIPRPTSKLTARRTSPPRAAGTTGNGSMAIALDIPQTVVKPRTYSRTRRSSFVTIQNDPASSFKSSRRQPPRTSLPATASQHTDGSNDLSGVRQQLPLTRYSRHSLASIDAMVSSATAKEENITTTSLRVPGRITINTSVTKIISPAIPHRQLMAPLGPPMPRSQTMGNLTCFAGAATNTPSPSKSSKRTVSTISQESEVDVMDALAESRMTQKEIEHFNQVAKEVEANRQRMKGRKRDIGGSSNNKSTTLASSNNLTSIMRSDRSSDLVGNEYDDMMVGDSSKKLPFQGAKLKIMSRSSPSISPPVLTPDSGVSMGSESTRSWEMHAKLVCKRSQTSHT